MRAFLGASAGLLLSTPLFFLNADPGNPTPGDPHLHDPQKEIEVCATGCSAVPALDKDLTEAKFRELIAAYATQPMSQESEALETLLFHGAATRALLDAEGFELDDEREAFLRRELAITHARVDVRVIDVHGEVRMHLGESRFPLGVKEHVHAHETSALQAPEVSGTVHRVGVKHLWARF